jgi:hypothetical protein
MLSKGIDVVEHEGTSRMYTHTESAQFIPNLHFFVFHF